MSSKEYILGQVLNGMLAHCRNGHGYRPLNKDQHWHEAIVDEAMQITAIAMEKLRENEHE